MATRVPAEPLTDTGVAAWKGFLRAHARLTRALDDELRESHGFTLGDLDVLIQLDEEPRGRLRMCDLAAAVVLSPSGLSRRVERLERAGLVARERAEHDARSVEARLSPAGKRLLIRLRTAHREGVRDRFADRFSPDELETLAQFMGRLSRDA